MSVSGFASGFDPVPAWIRVGGNELHYVEQGRGDPLVLLHGGIGDYRSWLPVTPRANLD
jgi:pimeloyl-ACP methyl ester carboxylesterase